MLVSRRNGRRMNHLVIAILLPLGASAEQHPAITYAISPPGRVSGMTVDASGNVYIAGVPNSTFRTTPGVAYPNAPGGANSYLIKLNPEGQLLYATYLPGAAGPVAVAENGEVVVATMDQGEAYRDNQPRVQVVGPKGSGVVSQPVPICPPYCSLPTHIALDREGSLYFASGSPLLVRPDANRIGAGGSEAEAFVLKMNPRTGAVLYATHFGGSKIDRVGGLAVDEAGNAYVSGETDSPDFPVTPNAYKTTAPTAYLFGFLLKLNPTGSALLYSTYLDRASEGLAVDSTGAAYAGSWGITKVSPDGRSVVFPNSVGPATRDVAVDRLGNTVGAGYSFTSTSVPSIFPQINPLQAVGTNTVRATTCFNPVPENPYNARPCFDAALAKFDQRGNVLWSSALGGSGDEDARKVSFDAAGNIYAWIDGFAGFSLPGMSRGPSSIIKIEPAGPPPLVRPEGVVSSANFKAKPGLGGLASLFGTGLTSVQGVAAASSYPLPGTLEGTSVWFGARQARLLAVANVNGQEQVNVQIPNGAPFDFESWPGQNIFIRKGRLLGIVPVGWIDVFASVFTDANGKPLVTHADFQPVSATSPAKAGETIIVFATGLGWVEPPVNEGDAAPLSPLARTVTTPVVHIGWQEAAVAFSGLVPGFAGLYQVNVVVPALPPGAVDLTIGVRPFVHDTVRIEVR